MSGPQDPAEILSYAKPCHFCAGRPTVAWVDDKHFRICCAAKKCSEKPSTEAHLDAGGESPSEERRSAEVWTKVIAEWNRIARLQPRLPL